MRNRAKLPLEALEPVLLPFGPVSGPQVLYPEGQEINRFELEVGFGKGLHLVNASLVNPHTGYLGIEIERKYVLGAATSLVKKGIRNVRLIQGDAAKFIADLVQPEIFDSIHVYFPDPWWKKRHHKRRLVTQLFLENCLKALKLKGVIHFATDVEAYFQMTEELLVAIPKVEKTIPLQIEAPAHDMDYLTHFERKARLKGKPIFRWDLRKLV